MANRLRNLPKFSERTPVYISCWKLQGVVGVGCADLFNRDTVETPADTQTKIRLASHLVKAIYSRSRGHEYESPVKQDSEH